MENNKQEDLDMISVIRGIQKLIFSLFNSIVWFFEFNIKKIFGLLLFVLIGAGISFGIYMTQKPYFTSHCTIAHSRFENYYCDELITNLNSYLNEYNDNAELAKIFNISTEYAKSVKAFKYLPLIPGTTKSTSDSVAILLPFKVEIEIYDYSSLDTLQKGLINYLESNEYGQLRKEADRSAYEKSEQIIIKELEQIDSLKRIVKDAILPRYKMTGVVIGQPLDPVSVHNKAIQLAEARLLINKKKALNESFELVVGFSKKPSHSNPKKLIFLGIGGISSYLLGLLVFLFRHAKKNLK